MLFPAYSRALNASRMILPPPALSPPVTPYVFGTSSISQTSRGGDSSGLSLSMLTSRGTGFALSKYGNYAAVVQSRQHLEIIGCDQMSRYLYSEPQFPTFRVSQWTTMPLPSTVHNLNQAGMLNMRGTVQAKSTPELMRRYTRAVARRSNASSARLSLAKQTQLTNAVSLRPNSFSIHSGRRARPKSQGNGNGVDWSKGA
ncbi:hypothetical protein BX661DRAFT_37964 [Kickxella alabastrina]|uniref:uncharacterized protein n=1 Tax=Kickxella alabastrina TaxID=61397 RepID=UPI00221EF377|nr:uncharacterized protein BX661DRAFT_37964 [Kickxella alabastrina]KAI7825401.1 hypothetical protein BX661DRAFT_37964 [Kickxella alabastrina]